MVTLQRNLFFVNAGNALLLLLLVLIWVLGLGFDFGLVAATYFAWFWIGAGSLFRFCWDLGFGWASVHVLCVGWDLGLGLVGVDLGLGLGIGGWPAFEMLLLDFGVWVGMHFTCCSLRFGFGAWGLPEFGFRDWWLACFLKCFCWSWRPFFVLFFMVWVWGLGFGIWVWLSCVLCGFCCGLGFWVWWLASFFLWFCWDLVSLRFVSFR